MEKVTHPIPPEPAEAHHGGHETSDASVSGIVKFAIGLAVGVAVVAALSVWGRNHWSRHDMLADPAPSPFANSRPPAPEPQLQPTHDSHESLPWEDMAKLHGEWARQLNTFGSVPGREGVARIPIARAMELAATRGLPATAPASQPPQPIGGGR